MEKEIKSIISERIIVGCLINNPQWALELKGLKYKHFTDKTNKTIFHLIGELFAEGYDTIDSLTILAKAEKYKHASQSIESSGGFEYLETLRELVIGYNVDDAKKHADVVMTLSYKREQIAQKERFIELVKENESWTITDINNWLQENQFALQSEYNSSGSVGLIGDVFDDVWDEIESSVGNDGTVGYPSKIPMVNKYFTYRKGELVVIGARAKFGKSNFGINEVHNLAVIQGIPVAYFDTEMKTRTFLSRMISIDSGIPLLEIENGSYKNDVSKLALVEASKERVRNAPIIHKYSYHWDKASVRETALLLQARYGIEFLIYDYIKVKEVGGQGTKEHSELGNWTITLKDLAGEMDIPILSFAQLSPYEMRLADSDKINRYASTIAYLLPKEAKDIARDGGIHNGGSDFLYVDYNRNGASMDDTTKGINLFYTRYNVTFEQATEQVLEDDYY